MLPLFSADQTFRHYESYTEILDEVDSIKPSDLTLQTNRVISRIHFRNELLDTPLFRPSSELGCETSIGRPRGADAFGKEFAALGYRSGYKQNVTARACCRWALMETDKKYCQKARIKHASCHCASLEAHSRHGGWIEHRDTLPALTAWLADTS
ncbi:hypothetical protein BDW69DRAFT_163609 [Aspergillus filifer]